MVKVLQQDRNHPLFGVLSQTFDMQRDITDTVVRNRPKTRSEMPRSVLSELGRHLFAHCVELWNNMAEEARRWYSDNAPPQFCTGFLWWTWSCLVKNYNAGPWTVNLSSIGGHCYICPQDAPEGIFAKGYVDTTEIGTLAHLDWDPACREEELPLLLVHGWHPEAFNPAEIWRAMAFALTGKDSMQEPDFALIYDPDRPGDKQYALKFLTGQGLDVYISNYTHAPGSGTPLDIRLYAQSLAREIEVLRSHKGAPAVDILSHSLGGIVARAYIENEDFSPNPYPAPYRDDVFNLIMLAPPNRGTRWSNLYPGWWDWTSILQLEPDSDFLAQLNSGVTGKSKGVTYHIIAGNYYICLHIPILPQTYHATRLCELEDDAPNDGELTVSQTQLSKQGSLLEVSPENFHVRSWDHWEMRGQWNSPCDSATIVKIILAGYSLAKWRAKGKDITPPEANYLQRCFSLIKRTDASRVYYDLIVDTNITIEFRNLPTGTVAQWFPSDNTIGVDISAEALDEKVTCQYIIHEAERSRWHGENSISGEYHAFKAEADFWNAVKKGDQNDHCDWVADFIAQGREAAMDYISTSPAHYGLPRYYGIPDSLEEAFEMLDSMSDGYLLCLNAQRLGVQIEYHYYNPATTEEWERWFAWYSYEGRKGLINEDWRGQPDEVSAAALAYLFTRAEWDSPDSIHQEWFAYYYLADYWDRLRGDLEHEFLDWVELFFPDTIPHHLSEMEPQKVWLRTGAGYYHLPLYGLEGQVPGNWRTEEPWVIEGEININNATAIELQGLPGIGPTLAQRIVDNRPYRTIEDLLFVQGIGIAIFEKIEDWIYAGPHEDLPPEEEEKKEEERLIRQVLGFISANEKLDDIYTHIQTTNIQFEFGQISVWARSASQGGLAEWCPYENTIKIDPDAKELAHPIIAQHVTHAAEHSRWKGQESLHEYFHAFRAERECYAGYHNTLWDPHCNWVYIHFWDDRMTDPEWMRSLACLGLLPTHSGVDEGLSDVIWVLGAPHVAPGVDVFLERNDYKVQWSNEHPEVASWYVSSTKTIYISVYLESLPPKNRTRIITAYLAYESVHAEWDRCYSIDQEYHAHKRQAEVWEAIRTTTFYQPHDQYVDLYLNDEATIKSWLRSQPEYADLPEVCPEEPEEEEHEEGKIDINHASQAQLETLPGIGPVLAQRIIEGRPYATIEDIMDVSGIGPVTFEAIKDLICTGAPEEPEEEEEEEEEGLSDEVYIQTCLDLINNTDEGHLYYGQLMSSGVGIVVSELAEGLWGVYYPDEDTIHLSQQAKKDGVKIGATILVHEAEHTRWIGENSINQEYHAYKAQSEFWNAVKGSDQHEFLDWCAGMALQGKHEAMDWLRGFYPCAGMPDYSEVEWDISTEFGMYDDLPQGYPKCLNSQRMGVQVGYHHYTMGCFAWYFRDEPSGKSAVVDETWQEDPVEATVAALAYLLTRVEWDRPDSINQEYVAFKEMAETWNLIKGDLEHGFCDEVAEVMAQEGSAPKDWIRNQPAYADLPEYGP